MPSGRILVVDDSNTIRRVVCGILERHGFEPSSAANGQLAVEALTAAEQPFDLVLLDFVMPKMNGFQFCRALRQDARLRDQHRYGAQTRGRGRCVRERHL